MMSAMGGTQGLEMSGGYGAEVEEEEKEVAGEWGLWFSPMAGGRGVWCRLTKRCSSSSAFCFPVLI